MTQSQALEILKTGANIFLNGEPGSGKTYLINQYVAYLRSHGIEPAITASTGIAATHIGGMTIHSWSGIGIKEYFDKYDLDRIASIERIAKRIERTTVLIIDEVSMLSAQTLAMAEAVCREVKRNQLPFGGLQIIFVGDFFQLPPIVKSIDQSLKIFAYNSQAWQSAKPVVCYLTEQFRQDDQDLSAILSAIRSNNVNSYHLDQIEARQTDHESVDENVPRFFTHNAEVDRVNAQMLAKLPGEAEEYLMTSKGSRNLVETLKKGCLSPEKLFLKVGAAVMFTKNNMPTGFVNGSLGIVEDFDSSGAPIVKIRDGKKLAVLPMEWALEENGKIRAKISQIPLRLAWAITVHKSQGMTMDAAAMDLSAVFEYGQGYVALSRVRKLSGLYLFGWNARTFEVHPEILEQDQAFRENSDTSSLALAKLSSEEIIKLQQKFILSCGGRLEAQERKTEFSVGKAKGETFRETLELWNSGKTILEIGQARKLQESTILSHIEKLADQGKISDLSRLMTPELEPSLDSIHSAFRELTAEHLSAIYAMFQGKFSYDQLRIARMFFKKVDKSIARV